MSARCYRIDAVPMPPDKMISCGHQGTVTVSAEEWAERLAAHCRLSRPEYRDRPIRVMVWPHRGETEHYRTPPPPSPISTTFVFKAGLPDRATHTCPECADAVDEVQGVTA